MSEAVPQSIYNVVLLDKYRIQDASGVSLVSAYIMRTNVQLELW
jgi:hypothetical protein